MPSAIASMRVRSVASSAGTSNVTSVHGPGSIVGDATSPEGVADLRRAFRDELARAGMREDDIEVLFQDFHVVLNRS